MFNKRAKNKKYRINNILTLLFVLQSISATLYCSENQNSIDSVLNIIERTEGVDKLKLLEKHAFMLYSNPQLIDKLEQEAIEQSDHLYKAYIYQLKIYNFGKEDQFDSLKHYQNLIEEELQLFNREKGTKINQDEKERYKTIKNSFLYQKAELLLHDGKYNLALMVIEEILDKSRLEGDELFERQGLTLLGLTYLYSKKWEEALNSFKSAYLINEKILNKKSERKLNKYSYFQSGEGIIYSYQKLDKHEEAIKASDSIIKRVEEEYETIPIPSTEEKFLHDYVINKIYSISSFSHIQTGNLKEARKQLNHVNKFLSEFSSLPHSNFSTYYYAEAEYYILTKEYDLAKKNVSSLIETYTKGKNPFDYVEFNLLLAKILRASGNDKEAYELLYDIYQINDSINRTSFSDQVAELQIIHQVEKAELRANQESEKLKLTRIILATISFIFILLLYLLFLSKRNTKKLKEKNLQLYKQYSKIQESNKVLHKLQLGKIEPSENKSDPYDNIMNKLKEYLSNNKAYKNPQLSREELALAIGTNRQYLIQAIKEKTGKTFNEFIYEYRLKYAYEKIVSDRNQSISQIFIDSGFSTRVTFNKVFKKAFGMSPSELRDVLEEF